MKYDDAVFFFFFYKYAVINLPFLCEMGKHLLSLSYHISFRLDIGNVHLPC